MHFLLFYCSNNKYVQSGKNILNSIALLNPCNIILLGILINYDMGKYLVSASSYSPEYPDMILDWVALLYDGNLLELLFD